MISSFKTKKRKSFLFCGKYLGKKTSVILDVPNKKNTPELQREQKKKTRN